jgi:hypothetical protein
MDAGVDHFARTEAILTALDEADHATRDAESSGATRELPVL